MGVRCEKNNDPSNVNRIPAGDGKVTLMFRATVAVRNGNISYIFNMATKKIATGEDAAVTVRVSDDAPSGVQVKSASGWGGHVLPQRLGQQLCGQNRQGERHNYCDCSDY